jgi:hypothetical protein
MTAGADLAGDRNLMNILSKAPMIISHAFGKVKIIAVD